ncbi:MAG TPA: lipase family protein [Candidatus Elarobacter sp.]|nr:lipase family protein [Candidatus Elarobacter sp.]
MLRHAAAFAVTVALIGSTAPVPTTAAPAAGPPGAAFYVPPSPLPPGRHGDVIWTRPLTTAAALPHASQNVLVLYHTTSVDGRDVAVSGTVAIPSGTPPRRGGWPVISWAHGTTGDAPACTPSLDDANAPEHWYLGPVDALLDSFVARGYAVVQTDYEGQGTPGVHPYLVGVAEGRDVVDMVRAARAVSPQIGSRYVVMGHSQGGQSALFAASLARAWAPELAPLGGVALAPASHLGPWLRGLTSRQEPYLGFGFAALLIRGYASIDPAIHPERLLSDAAMPLQPQLTDRCVLGLIKPDSWAGISPAKAFRSDADLAPLLRQADANEPGAQAYGIPLLMLQGTADTTVAPASTDLVRSELCAKQATLTYRAMPGATHNGMLPDSFAITQPWIDARFGGAPATSNCAEAVKAGP